MAQLHYSVFTVQSSQITGTLTNFPVLVMKTDARFKDVAHSGNVNRSDGRDLIPYSSTALTTKLDFEREYYDPVGGTVIDWVRLPSAATSSVIVYGYGDTSITTDQQNVTGTWDSNFKSVQHLGDGTTLTVTDSTGLTTPTLHGCTTGTAQIRGGAIAGTSSDYIDLGSAHNFTSSAFTMSGWFWSSVLQSGGPPTGMMVFYKGQYQVNGYYANMGDDGTISFTTNQSGAHQNTITAAGVFAESVLQYVSFIRNGSAVTICLNGVDVTGTPGTHTNPTSSSDSFDWLSYNNGSLGPNADAWICDEVRVSDTNRSVAWELACYKNQSAPTSFLGIGTEQSVGGSSFKSAYARGSNIIIQCGDL